MALFYYPVHTDESRQQALDYFTKGQWYWSIKSNILAKFSTTDNYSNIGTWSGTTIDKHINMMDIDEWVVASEEKVEEVLSRHTQEEREFLLNN